MTNRGLRITGFLTYAFLTYVIGFLFWHDYFDVGFFLSVSVTPLCLGAIAQVLFDPKVEKKLWVIGLSAVGLTVLMMFVFVVLAFEAVACIVMSLPLIVPLEFLGVWLTRWIIKGQSGSTKTLSVFLLLPLVVLPFEGRIQWPQSNETVISEIVINAPVEVVWNHTVVIPEIQPNERIWTLSHSVFSAPQPISADLDGDVRSLSWTHGVLFKEIITESVLHRRLAWDFDFYAPQTLQAFDPHISPNSRMLKISDGFYELSQLNDGRTLLRLETHYQIRTPINGYVRLWGSRYLNDFHDSVLSVIKTRAETTG